MKSVIEKKLKKLPDTPGVYLFFNSERELIYVGKATSLRDRVRSYFTGPRTVRPIEAMIHEVVNLKTQSTDSALEAIILEGNLIKKFRPKYNIDWKDDKSWNYIAISKDKYPQVKFVREHEIKSNIKYQKSNILFGPYPHLKMREFEKILRKLFSVSFCQPQQGRPCLYRQIGQCLGVCSGEISALDYRQKVIRPLVLFLSGKKRSLLNQLNNRMKLASKYGDFEEAGRLRDQIEALRHIQDVALLNSGFTNAVIPNEARDLHFFGRNTGHIRIEGYDISNLGDTDKVGSMVVFDESGPIKSEYRKFNIKTVVGQSDVDCLAEVISRRIRHDEWPMPNIILIDGGVPQVHKVKSILSFAKITTPVIGIAKGPTRKNNEIIFSDRDLKIQKWAYANVKLLIQVRDEAHRFAIKFNRSKRKLR
ncbi:MAG: UvrB/UvrC motif-containing protein [Candidatus Magasanikbacteria bacterium]|jgi:excinuclease ABC subunit C